MIVAVVARRSAEDVRAALAALAAEPDVVRGEVLAEVRLDAMETPDPAVCGGAPLPVMATCRRPRDGGKYRGTEASRRDLLRAAAEAGAGYVDVESDVAAAFGRPPAGTKLVLSHHDFEGGPGDPRALARALIADGADFVKLAFRVRNALDLLALSRVAREAPGRIVVFGLGPAGLGSRLLFESFGSPWIYVRYDGGGGADGAPVPAELPTFDAFTKLHRAGRGAPPPEVAYGVLGDRAEESVGPRAFNAVFRRRGIAAQYVPIATASTPGVRELCRLLGLRGLSVTTPFKREALAMADDVHVRARAIGAANTLVNEGGVWTAYNTDADGVRVPARAALEAGRIPPAEARALVVGLGGAGLAAAWALRSIGCRTALVTRRASPPPSPLGDEIPVLRAADVLAGSADLVVQATPAGSPRDPDGRAVDLAWMKERGVVIESNYVPRETPLVLAARERGLRVVLGEEVYVAQAAAQLRFFRADCDDAETDLADAVRAALAGGP